MSRAALLVLCSLVTTTLCVIAPQIPDFKTGDKKIINGPFWHEAFTEIYEGEDDEDVSTTTSEPLPFFEDDASTNNVTAQLGSRVHLHCRVHDLGEKTSIQLVTTPPLPPSPSQHTALNALRESAANVQA
ncbi:lachesin-like [Phthorimaea operculella]|nr:lachesin-like [Phthorimaea operculella]